MQIIYVTGVEETKLLHISHLHPYVSAYETTEEKWTELAEDLGRALEKAAKTRRCQYIDQDGEMFLEVSPVGTISLCLRWKQYKNSYEK